jgi:hypothetical protein
MTKRQYLTMNTAKPPHALLASQKCFFKGILRSRRTCIIAVVLLGIGGVRQRANGSESNDTSTPGPSPTPSATVAAASPTPAASPSPTAPVAAATPAPTAVQTATQIDPKLIGNWEISDSQVKPSENVTWEIQSNGRYRLEAGSEHKTGILSTSEGKIRLNVEFTGVTEMPYKIDDSTLTTTAPDGTAIDWRPVKSEAKPHKVVHRHHPTPPHRYVVRDWFHKVKKFFGFSE